MRARSFVREFTRSAVATCALVIVVLAIAGATVAPVGSTRIDGASAQGALTSLLQATGSSLGTAALATIVAFALGTTLGILAAIAGPPFESALFRAVEIELCIPGLLLAMAAAVAVGDRLSSPVPILAFAQWPAFAQAILAAHALSRGRGYVAASRALCLSSSRIVLDQVVPNGLTLLVAVAIAELGVALAYETTLGLIGVAGASPHSLGAQIRNGGALAFAASAKSCAAALISLALMISLRVLSRRMLDVQQAHS